MKNYKWYLPLALIIAGSAGVYSYVGNNSAEPSKEAASFTKDFNNQVKSELPFNNKEDFQDAKRGFIDSLPEQVIKDEKGNVIWNLKEYNFLKNSANPATVNPSLWRQSQLNLYNGLFKVTDKIYQIRGFDLSNMTIIEGNSGIVIIDPLISTECSKAGLDLYYKHRGKKPVKAVIYSHSHVDHFGGVKGVTTQEDVNSGKTQILAPEGFLEHAVSENVYAGNAMSRRAVYMYGALLPKSEKGQVDAGLGKTTSIGTTTLIEPTMIIKSTGEKKVIDGVEIEFLMAPHTEAPAEMLMYFPKEKALCTAEDATHTLHNIYTLRGAEVRDAKAWWKYLNETIERFGDKTEVVFAQHHWPKWGNKNILTFLSNQRDMFKYLHDQTLNLMNKGYTMVEIGEMIQLPDSLNQQWYNRGYYGSVNHNVKAIYQKYLGFYNSNPSTLYELPPVEAARKYVEFMGGADNIIKKARESFKKGEYRWVAQVMNQVVFADPNNTEAKNLTADALEQLGYQAENATWRNEFLMGAYELRNGMSKKAGTTANSSDVLGAMSAEMFFDYLGISLNSTKAKGKKIKTIWNITDTKEQYLLSLDNSVLIYTPDKKIGNPDATITLSKKELGKFATPDFNFKEQVNKGTIKITGSRQKLEELFSLMDQFDQQFPIVTPMEEVVSARK